MQARPRWWARVGVWNLLAAVEVVMKCGLQSCLSRKQALMLTAPLGVGANPPPTGVAGWGDIDAGHKQGDRAAGGRGRQTQAIRIDSIQAARSSHFPFLAQIPV